LAPSVYFSLAKSCAAYLADEEGIANAQKSLGLGNDDGSRRMRWLWSNQVSVLSSELFVLRHWRSIIYFKRQCVAFVEFGL